jgi:hypothetical protein
MGVDPIDHDEGISGNDLIVGVTSTKMTYPVQGTTDWTRVSTRLTVPEGTSELRIRARLSSRDNRGAKAWFDDILLAPVAN